MFTPDEDNAKDYIIPYKKVAEWADKFENENVAQVSLPVMIALKPLKTKNILEKLRIFSWKFRIINIINFSGKFHKIFAGKIYYIKEYFEMVICYCKNCNLVT